MAFTAKAKSRARPCFCCVKQNRHSTPSAVGDVCSATAAVEGWESESDNESSSSGGAEETPCGEAEAEADVSLQRLWANEGFAAESLENFPFARKAPVSTKQVIRRRPAPLRASFASDRKPCTCLYLFIFEC